MSRGRNTTVVGIRLPDEVVDRLKSIARGRGQTMTELLKPVIATFAVGGRFPNEISNSPRVEAESPRVKPELPHVVPSQTSEKFPKVARNAPCSCGSGKKYKRCCGNDILHR